MDHRPNAPKPSRSHTYGGKKSGWKSPSQYRCYYKHNTWAWKAWLEAEERSRAKGNNHDMYAYRFENWFFLLLALFFVWRRKEGGIHMECLRWRSPRKQARWSMQQDPGLALQNVAYGGGGEKKGCSNTEHRMRLLGTNILSKNRNVMQCCMASEKSHNEISVIASEMVEFLSTRVFPHASLSIIKWSPDPSSCSFFVGARHSFGPVLRRFIGLSNFLDKPRVGTSEL